MNHKLRVLFIIPSFTTGGAERQLCVLAQHMDQDQFDVHVLFYYAPGTDTNGKKWQEGLDLSGVNLHFLDKRPGPIGYLAALPRILGLMYRIRPDILHGYMDGNLLALLLGFLFHKRVVWGIRRTSQDLSQLNRLNLCLLKVDIWLSPFVDLIIFNSESGRLSYGRMGMRSPRMQVVPNGFDIDQFSPDISPGTTQRQLWGIPDDVPLIGIVARLHPTKDHPTFLRAVQRLSQEWPTAKFVCVGDGSTEYAESLRIHTKSLGVSDRVIWPGTCSQMPAVYNALTILVLSSTDEGFPNAVGEAMACGIPCVVTRVGDAARIIGDTGFVAEIGDDEAIANAVSTLLRESGDARVARGRACRQRICASFSVQALARNTEQALMALFPGSPKRDSSNGMS